jgi:hypothetical protein
MNDGLGDRELSDMLIRIDEAIRLVQSQLDVIKGTIGSCENIVSANYMECIPAVSIADVEAMRLMELNVNLIKLIHDLKDHVYLKHL